MQQEQDAPGDEDDQHCRVGPSAGGPPDQVRREDDRKGRHVDQKAPSRGSRRRTRRYVAAGIVSEGV